MRAITFRTTLNGRVMPVEWRERLAGWWDYQSHRTYPSVEAAVADLREAAFVARVTTREERETYTAAVRLATAAGVAPPDACEFMRCMEESNGHAK